MKLNTIKQLILRFIGWGKIQIPTRFLKSVDIESPDINQGEDTPGSISLNDFENFNISLANDYYVNYNIGDIIPLDELLNVSSVDVLKALTSLSNNLEIFSDPSIYFYDNKSEETGSCNHNIIIFPNGLINEMGYNIEINTNREYTNGDEAYYESYSIYLIFNGETLEVVNINQGGE